MDIVLYSSQCTACGKFGSEIARIRKQVESKGNRLLIKSVRYDRRNIDFVSSLGAKVPILYNEKTKLFTEDLRNIDAIL
jgi:hypothetical protein